MKEFDPEALAAFDGKDGRPAYIAHGNRVIDVSASRLWKDGLHMRRHQAGRNLTADIQAAPHGLEVLERCPQVGTLAGAPAGEEPRVSSGFGALLDRFPVLRRHPHPMTVHFPIVFAFAAAAFTLLHRITGVDSFQTTALHCLAGLVLCAPVAAATGLLTWHLNYGGRPMRAVTVKKRLTALLCTVAVAAFGWGLAVPGPLSRPGAEPFFFLLLVLSAAAMVAVIGWFGAQLTFPTER